MHVLVRASDSIIITYSVTEYSSASRDVHLFFDEINRRLENELVIIPKYQPFERARISSLSGKTDGDILRTRFVYNVSDSMILIDVPLYISRLYAFCIDSAHAEAAHPVDSIRYIHYKGNHQASRWCAMYGVEHKEFAEIQQAVKFIITGEADCIIGSQAMNKGLEIKERKMYQGSNVLLADTTYLFIHQSKVRHVPFLTKILQDMSDEGVINILISSEIKGE